MRRWTWVCLLVIVAGLAGLAWSTLPVVADCDGLTMGPDDSCTVYDSLGRWAETYSYDETVAGERRQRTAARTGGAVLVAAGVLAYAVGTAARRRETTQWREGHRGPEAIARALKAGDLGGHVCTVALRGDRTLHLHREGLVVEHRHAVQDVVAWRDVDGVEAEVATGADGHEWVHTCVLAAHGHRTTLRARPDDHSTLTAVANLVEEARSRRHPD